MTLEQLMSPQVTEWIDNVNKRLNEGVTLSDDALFSEFDEWFVQNEKEINESIKKPVKVNEGRFDDVFDDEDEDSKPEDRKTTVVDDETDPDDDIDGDDETDPDEDPVPEDEEEISRDPRAKHKVDNSKNPKRNVFKVVNILYDKIIKEGKNMDKVTYLKFLDTSDVHDMTALLAFTNLPNADLSSWDTSGVVHMEGMFYKSTFNNDSICGWNVTSCADFKNMFLGSKFNQSLNRWKPKMIKVREVVDDPEEGRKTVEVEKHAPLPFVGAYEDEEKEMAAAFWDEKFKDAKLEKKSKYDHLMDFETFMINEGIWDKAKDVVKKGVKKVKELFKVAALKVNKYFVTFLGENGEPIPAVNPYTTLNYISGGAVEGVKAYSPVKNSLLNDTVGTDAELIPDRGFYGNIKEEDVEYQNFQTFVKLIEESNNKGKFDDIIEESGDRVGFSAVSGGIRGIKDINSTALKKYIAYQMKSTPATMGKDYLRPILIWGAPGVGKSTIPNAIISEYNKTKTSSEEKKALIVAECGDMTPDGFALPMPNRMTMTEYMDARPSAKKLASEIGLSDEELENSIIVRSSDAPKMWLPCYKPDPDKRINDIRKMIANGHIREYYDENGDYQIEETCDGGLIMFDEFFRADPSIFKILMQILLNRSYGGCTLGDKWGIIACSNRPNDDTEVAQSFEQTGAVVTTRFSDQYNFIPDFKDWKKWAEEQGHFDEVTLAFLVNEKDADGEYVNWHSINPDQHSEGYVGHPTPRSWSALMNKLYNVCKIEGYHTISEIPEEEMEDHVFGAIGEEVGRKYVDWIYNKSDSVLNVKKVFEDPEYVMPNDPLPKAAEVTEKILNYVELTYSEDNCPPEEYLINMFNLLDRTYSKGKDNYIKEMHIKILEKFFTKENRKALMNYFKMCDERYNVNE